MPSIKQETALKGRRIEITLDHLPEADLSPNSRCHWSVYHRAVKAAQEEIGWMAKSAIQNHLIIYPGEWDKPMMKAQINYMFHLKDHRKRDLDNLLASCKAYQDGLIEAGVIFYDDAEHLSIGSVKAEVTGHEEMIITITEGE